MSKRAKAKHYKPRWVDPADALSVITKKQWIPDSATLELVAGLRIVFDALKKGRGDRQSALHSLAMAINVSLLLAEKDIGGEYLDDIKAVMPWLAKAIQRGQRTGVYLLDGPAFALVDRAIEIHKAQLENSRRGEVAAAMIEVQKRIAAGDVIED